MPRTKEDLDAGLVPGAEAGELTPKQEEFCQQYIIDLDAKQAYLRVYKCDPLSAEASGSRLLSNVKIQARVAQLKAKRQKRTEITQDWVLKRYREIANENLNDFFTVSENGTVQIKPKAKIPKGATGISYSIGKGGESISIQSGRMAALKELAEHVGLSKGNKGSNNADEQLDSGGVCDLVRKLKGEGSRK